MSDFHTKLREIYEVRSFLNTENDIAFGKFYHNQEVNMRIKCRYFNLLQKNDLNKQLFIHL